MENIAQQKMMDKLMAALDSSVVYFGNYKVSSAYRNKNQVILNIDIEKWLTDFMKSPAAKHEVWYIFNKWIKGHDEVDYSMREDSVAFYLDDADHIERVIEHALEVEFLQRGWSDNHFFRVEIVSERGKDTPRALVSFEKEVEPPAFLNDEAFLEKLMGTCLDWNILRNTSI